jgi:hypothetical protein
LTNQLFAADEFNQNKNTEVFVNGKTMKVRERPFVDSKVLYSKKENDKFIIKGCNKFGWCELETGGYAPDFLLKGNTLKAGFKKDFTLNKNSLAIVKTNILDVFERPYYKSEIIDKKIQNELLNINGCDTFGWCELKEGGYIKSALTTGNIKNKIQFKEITPKKKEIVEPIKTPIMKLKEKALPIKKETPILDKYKVALTHYKNKEYEDSYKLFRELFEENLNEVNTNFYLGRSAFELKKYSEALGAYERVLFEKPNALRTKYEMAKTFFLVNDLNNSKKLFLELKRDKKVKPRISKNIDKYLLAIDKRTNKHIFRGAFIFGLGYDSNIENSPYDKTYIPDIDLNLDNVIDTGDEISDSRIDDSDYSHEEAINLNYSYLIDNKKSFNNNFLVYAKSLFEHDQKDIIFLSYNPSLNYIVNSQLQFSPGIFIDNLRLDNENYIVTYGLNPKLDYSIDSDNKLNIALKYQNKNYQTSDDKSYYELKFINKHIYNPNNVISIESKIVKEKNKIDKNEKSNNYSLKISDMYLPNNRTNFIPSISYDVISYSYYTNPLIKKNEKTKKLKFELINNYIYSKNYIIKTAASYEDSNSNLTTSEYNKYKFNINLIRPF